MKQSDRPQFGIERLFVLALVVFISLAFALLIEPFFGAIMWGVVVAVLFQPVYKKISGWLFPRINLAAFLTLILVILLVIVPAILLGMALMEEATSAYASIQSGEIDFGGALSAIENSLPAWAQNQLAAFGYGDPATIRPQIEEAIGSSLEFLIAQAFNVGQGAFRFLLALGVMLYLTFFLLRDGRTLAAQIENVVPLSESKSRIFIDKFFVVIIATIKGSFVVALLQGTIGGLIFWALDIRGALLWAVSMAILSLIPAIGTGFIWVPVAIYLLVTGSIWQGVVLILAGIFIISMVDNLVRPILVGRETRMPDYVVLISTLGGLQLFGFNGIVIGPLLAALFIAVWRIFAEMNKAERERIAAIRRANDKLAP
ncbi:AI-2E family transporter [Parasphingorhabdus cellanae]|uniref:AI-2E family transporter n=1 Tax=Parasphingorhabdus cellanae TaxID=2806553 RepID=A0ABX7SZT5_9SPHN|nr:AI-2E family transporter [Parasphingorhabdus cellanae]QTD54775.1 AI-2E family transporter [Parasphingorhabdus cellanae]